MAKRQRLSQEECELEEATATSILSRRWRYLHTWTSKLDLDRTESIGKPIKHLLETSEKQKCEYIEWVDHILSQRRSSTFEEFRVLFDLDRSYSPTIDEWLRFALSRRVEKLELNLTSYGESGFSYPACYNFPYRGDELKFLKKLSTNCVNVDGEFVKEVVHNCRLLEHLSMTESGILYVEIIKPSPSLKYLEISHCCDLESLVIRDSNIATLKVAILRKINVVLQNVPLLAELWCVHIGGFDCTSMEDIGLMFSTVFPQLHLLELNTVSNYLSKQDMRNFCSHVDLRNLKQFVVAGILDKALVNVIYLMNASPVLERLVIVLDCEKGTPKKPPRKRAGKQIRNKYPCLKEVKILGYRGTGPEFEMVMHLVENSVALKNIVVDPLGVDFRSLTSEFDYTLHQITRPSSAAELKNYIPSRINLEIL